MKNINVGDVVMVAVLSNRLGIVRIESDRLFGVEFFGEFDGTDFGGLLMKPNGYFFQEKMLIKMKPIKEVVHDMLNVR